jgi:hypothetical protein
MKKILVIVAVLVMSSSMLFSQAFEKGNHGINFGIGFGNTAYFGSYYTGFIPSVSASYELGIVEVPMGSELTGVVSVGGYAGWSASRYEYDLWGNSDWYYTGSSIVIAARGNYHFIFNDKLDTYAGVWFGLGIENWTWHGSSTLPSTATLENSVGPKGGAYVGARYFFSPAFAAYAELGYLISVFNIGVTYKIQGNN